MIKRKLEKHRLEMLGNLIDNISSKNTSININTMVYYMFYSVDNKKVTNCRLQYETIH